MSMTTLKPFVQLDNVSFTQDNRHILERIHLSLEPSTILSIIGPNGAGKTTLLKMMIGLIKPTHGNVFQQAGLRIGYMPQRLHIDPIFPITVYGFLKLGQPKVELTQILKEVGIGHVLHSPLQAISGGEFQRVLLARALLREPDLLVLDEPAQGVDLVGQSELYDLIAKIRDQYGCAIVLVSHDLHVVMAQTDLVVCLNQHVCCYGSPEKISRDPAFMAMFGDVAKSLAIYTHHHDHRHDTQGDVMNNDHKHQHD